MKEENNDSPEIDIRESNLEEYLISEKEEQKKKY